MPLLPLCAEALQRERRQMQAKHLWYNLDIRWVDLENKLRCLPPLDLPGKRSGSIFSHQAASESLCGREERKWEA